MDAMPVADSQANKKFFQRAERADLLLRIEFAFDGLPIFHGTTDNGGYDGLFAHCPDAPCKEMVGRVGTCRVFLGTDYLEMPCRVARVLGDGLGIHLLEGYDEEYNMVMGHMVKGDTAEMGLDREDAHVGLHSQMIGEIHTLH